LRGLRPRCRACDEIIYGFVEEHLICEQCLNDNCESAEKAGYFTNSDPIEVIDAACVRYVLDKLTQ